jgi:OmpA-OmpF porin, OOP family
MQFKGAAIALCAAITLLAGGARAQETNLLALGEGTLPVVEPASYGGWEPVNMLDDSPQSAWCSAAGNPSNNVFVFEMLEPATIGAFEFDCTVDGKGRGAKDVTVEVSAGSRDAGFEKVLQASLLEGAAGQRFAVARKVTGRWVRLTVATNHGDGKYSELSGFRGYGLKPDAPAAAPSPITGSFSTNYSEFHLRRQGTAISGCYGRSKGLFEGTIEGRLAKITWSENDGSKHGPAVFVFTPDGESFRGYWWHGSDKGREVDGGWSGKRVSNETGSCPHWSGSVAGELQKELATKGRARLYGILFDTDSARIRAESYPTLDEVVRMLASEGSWSLTIEGHTDSTGTAAHNQALSEQRAKSVRDYLTSKGVAAARSSTAGFGQTKPVADNATELGRAQNRRVELVKK